MRLKLPVLINLTHILIALYVLDLTYSREVIVNKQLTSLPKFRNLVVHKILYTSKIKMHSIIYIVYIIHHLVNVLSKEQLRVAVLVLLLEGRQCYPIYNYYIKKYRFFFRKICTTNNISSRDYDNNRYIDTMALISLRVILLSSQVNGNHFFWFYLANYTYKF